jgi:hypothetical protein
MNMTLSQGAIGREGRSESESSSFQMNKLVIIPQHEHDEQLSPPATPADQHTATNTQTRSDHAERGRERGGGGGGVL